MLNKADRARVPRQDGREGLTELDASALSEQGVDALREALTGKVGNLAGGDFPAVTRIRHRRHLESAAQSLRRGAEALKRSPELAAEDLRHAALSLGRIAGRIDPEQILDEVFSSFCIGK